MIPLVLHPARLSFSVCQMEVWATARQIRLLPVLRPVLKDRNKIPIGISKRDSLGKAMVGWSGHLNAVGG